MNAKRNKSKQSSVSKLTRKQFQWFDDELLQKGHRLQGKPYMCNHI